uniref:Uncharacterized protein n=1 Tax=Francisella tularensis subsp. novicida PA10-7858 TaxID=1386968 RepID=V5T8W6_FRANO|nr:hypothetical protein [Francisella tularensis]AHB60810.1 hypothetical protein N894_0042 [Francisella tularensis subsp. novicida PA10-7858]
MKLKNRQNRKPNIEEFINSADSDHVTGNDNHAKEEKKKYKRVTFSLDEETKQLIETLSIKSTTSKTSNSDIVKIATRYLSSLDNNAFEAIVTKFK